VAGNNRVKPCADGALQQQRWPDFNSSRNDLLQSGFQTRGDPGVGRCPSDPQFAQQALQAFRKCGFQLVIVATVQNATTIQPYIDSVVMESKTEATGRNARPVATAATGRSRNSARCVRRCARRHSGCRPASDAG
jgi:hypothetical protein